MLKLSPILTRVDGIVIIAIMNTKKAILKNLSLFLTSKKSNNKNVPIVLYEKLKNIEIAKIVRISLFLLPVSNLYS